MNKLLKVLSLIAVLSISSISLAHDWNFLNVTDKSLVVKLKLQGIPDNFFNIVGPGQKTSFSWTGINTRARNCLGEISIGEYNESLVANFPDTNSPMLPKRKGTNTLDSAQITKAIDARGQWFNSLAKVAKENNAMFLDQNQWNDFSQKMNPVAGRLINGMSLAQSFQGFDPNTILKSPSAVSSSIVEDLQSSAVVFATRAATENKPNSDFKFNRCTSRDFVITMVDGVITAITNK